MVEKTNLNPSEVGDIVVGTVLAPGSLRAIECRMAAFYAGFPGKFSFILFHCMRHFWFLLEYRCHVKWTILHLKVEDTTWPKKGGKLEWKKFT